ncbi:unnamed protein product [Cunninghamella echinulata]
MKKNLAYKTNDKKRKNILSLRQSDKKIKHDNKNINELLSNTQQENTPSPVTEKPTSSSSTTTTFCSSTTTDATLINNNSNNNILKYKNNASIESFTSSSTTSLGEYQCPICNTI